MTDREKFIAIVDNDSIRKSDAIILLEGDGLNRYPKAVSLYKKGYGKKIVFSGGITNYEYGSFPFSDILPHLLNESIPREDIIHENISLNTREQAIEVVKLSIANKWDSIILVASHQHQYRAYLTFLRELLDVKKEILLYNAPIRDLLWFDETGWGSRFVLLEKEFERIEQYTSLGHLASFNEVFDYQKWKEAQAQKK